MKKMIYSVLIITLATSLSACAGSEAYISIKQTESTSSRFKEIKIEETDPTEETEITDTTETTEAPKVVFNINDAKLRNAVCEVLGITDIDEDTSKAVTELDLSGKGLTDITDLSFFTNLRKLDLSNNPITDVSALSSVTKLEELNLRGTIVTDTTPVTSMSIKTLSLPKTYTSGRYLVVVDDCTWFDAFTKANAIGGHLATIDSDEEFNTLVGVLEQSSLEVTDMKIGARRETFAEEFYNVNAQNELYGDPIKSNWLPGEPSMTWHDYDEYFVELKNDAQSGKWGLNDVANITYTPGYEKFGYIIEFD